MKYLNGFMIHGRNAFFYAGLVVVAFTVIGGILMTNSEIKTCGEIGLLSFFISLCFYISQQLFTRVGNKFNLNQTKQG